VFDGVRGRSAAYPCLSEGPRKVLPNQWLYR